MPDWSWIDLRVGIVRAGGVCWGVLGGGSVLFTRGHTQGSFENLAVNSSRMLPPFERVSIAPVTKFWKCPSGGPLVPRSLTEPA